MPKSVLQDITIPPGGFETLQIHQSKNKVKAILRIYHLKEAEQYVLYIPSLEVSGYGENKAMAEKMIHEVLHDLFKNLLEMKGGQIEKELAKYNWDHDSYFSKRFENRSYVDKNGILKDFDLPKDTPIEEKMVEFT